MQTLPTHFLELSDGRRLCYCEFGDRSGTPIFYCHGFPSSRLEAGLAAEAAKKLHLRLIAVDRPGLGQSSPQPDRHFKDFPDDIVALADHLNIERFSLVAVSGGGPYAMACAEQHPLRVDKLVLICTLGSYEPDGSTKGMRYILSSIIHFVRYMPGAGHWFFKHIVCPILGRFPKLILLMYVNRLTQSERTAFLDKVFYDNFLCTMRESFNQGSAGPAWELKLLTSAWDINPANIKAETWLWHGEADSVVPSPHGHRHAKLIPNCHARFLPEEGHFSLIYNSMETILRKLVE